MTSIGEARRIAGAWVAGAAPGIDAFLGAYVTGSAAWLPADATLAATSDVDVTIVIDSADSPPKTGKFPHKGILLDVSFTPAAALGTAERILADYHLAGTFRHTTIVADPAGTLGALQRAVIPRFANPAWVWRRCEGARDKVLAGLDGLDETAPLAANALVWAFPTGVTAHILLAAGLRSPTIRTRYLAVRRLLVDAGRTDAYEPLLDLLGCTTMGRDRAMRHLGALALVFDAASAANTTGTAPFPFASDITAAARPIAIDGSRELIARGDHREAVFWLVVTWARSLQILDHVAPGSSGQFENSFGELLADLGVATIPDLLARADTVRAALPGTMAVARQIIDAIPELTKG